MYAKDLENGTTTELEAGTVFTAEDGRKMILGDTDTVAFQDPDGEWQVAENVYWYRVEHFEGAMEEARWRKHNTVLRGFAASWCNFHGTSIYEGISEDVVKYIRESDNYELTEDDVDTVLSFVSSAKITFD